MGSGKTTTAACLGELLQRRVIEMDDEISKRAGKTIPEIFNQEGEEAFRQMETGLLRELKDQKNTIVSCGGGVPMREENVRLMKESGQVVLLLAKPETVLRRLKGTHQRPLLEGRMNVEAIRLLMEERRPFYEAAADLQICVDDKSVRQVAEEILKSVRDRNKAQP